MKRGWNRWQLGFGLLLLAAPAWGETLPVESPSSVLNPPHKRESKPSQQSPRLSQLLTHSVWLTLLPV
jgi:hypothetical protein